MRQFPELSDEQVKQWLELVHEKTGIWITEQRKSFLKNGLIERIKALGETSYDSYFKLLQDSKWAEVEWAHLVDKLTVHETRFYRHEASFNLARIYARKWIQQKEANTSYEVWSVGCSTGEEVYSLAFLLEDLKQELGEFFYGVTGTDISFPALAQARDGKYNLRNVQTLPLPIVENYFEKVNEQEYRVTEAIKQRTCFVQGNIREFQRFAKRGYNLIMCQNLLIYFKQKEKHQILNQLATCLAPGGILLLAPGETLKWQHPLIERVNNKDCLAFVRRAELQQ